MKTNYIYKTLLERNANLNLLSNDEFEKCVQIILSSPQLINTFDWMEQTNGEPTLVSMFDNIYLVDLSTQSPNRRSLCYDRTALINRKKFVPENDALSLAHSYFCELLTEQDYRFLNTIKPLDTKTSSWIHTPKEIRDKGGAIFCDNRYGAVFVYHNSADSYYSSRGFRVKVKII
ncbi:DUF4256 domain-containing protein [Mycoplasma sp. 4463]|uniref:DUF4256 domain-containing protein n=1 Tax=Mycoplasma sp. 4463 TaxID=3400998 RepID=UPI003AAC730B